MKALVQNQYGSPDLLELRDIDMPAAGDSEVLVRVKAAGVDPGVWHLVAGQPYFVRMMGFGLFAPKNKVPGLDLAGVVEAIGADVTRFAVGDEVCGFGSGSFAEYAVAAENRLVQKPDSISFEQAAVLPVSGVTAMQAFRNRAQLQPGQRVLVTGAGGGVGSYAVQIAKTDGAHVTAMCGPSRAGFVAALGADEVIDRTREDVDARGALYDVIIDSAGRRPLSVLKRAMTPTGSLVIVGGEGGGKLFGGFGRSLAAPLASAFSKQSMKGLISKESLESLQELTALVASGSVVPQVGRTYPLAAGVDAIHDLHDGKALGKLAITI